MAISFSASAKAEICRGLPSKPCCAVAECFGILLFCNSFSPEGIRIVTESREFAQALPKLFKKAFSLEFDSQPQEDTAAKLIFTLTDPAKLQAVFNRFGFDRDKLLQLHLNYSVFEDSCCHSAFLRGAFLAGGSVADPEKGSHLELTTTHAGVARQCFALMQEVLPFAPGLVRRSGSHVLYFKHSDNISDFLTWLGAPIAAMGIMEARLEKELNNKVNRRCNCDDANISKVVKAAQEQLAAIRILQQRRLLQHLPKKLSDAAYARLNNPEASLTELAAMMQPPITKPAMNQRLKKLVSLSKE